MRICSYTLAWLSFVTSILCLLSVGFSGPSLLWLFVAAAFLASALVGFGYIEPKAAVPLLACTLVAGMVAAAILGVVLFRIDHLSETDKLLCMSAAAGFLFICMLGLRQYPQAAEDARKLRETHTRLMKDIKSR